jgi:hypothetical protein
MDIITERAADYGPPEANLSRTAALWSSYLGTCISAHDVAMCMILVKVSRAKAGSKADNYTDIAGYAEIAEQLR